MKKLSLSLSFLFLFSFTLILSGQSFASDNSYIDQKTTVCGDDGWIKGKGKK